MPSHLNLSDYPWVDVDEITQATPFTLNVPLLNSGDETADEHDRIIVHLSLDFTNEHREFPTTAVGLEPHQYHTAEFHFNSYELSAGQWQVNAKREHDSHYSEYHTMIAIGEVE